MTEKTFVDYCSDNFLKFYIYTKKYCEKHNKKITVVNQLRVKKDGGYCSGWCDGDEMVISFKNPFFEQVYCHEFSHMKQYVEKSPLWNFEAIQWNNLQNKTALLQNWHKLYSVIALERDCEARALRFSKRYNLFNNLEYTKRANTYLYLHHFCFMKQKWVDFEPIYQSEQIYNRMPSTLLRMKDLQYIDMKLMILFNDCIKQSKQNRKS